MLMVGMEGSSRDQKLLMKIWPESEKSKISNFYDVYTKSVFHGFCQNRVGSSVGFSYLILKYLQTFS